MSDAITGWSEASFLLAYATKVQENVHYPVYPPPVQEVPVTEELPPIEELPPDTELPPVTEDYSEEPEPEEIDNREEDTGQNVDTFA